MTPADLNTLAVTTFFCVRCQKRTQDYEIDCDTILLRDEIYVYCHGSTALMTMARVHAAARVNGGRIELFSGG